MSLDDRIQAYLRATAPDGREVVELGGLTATFNREDPLRYRNYAIPGPPPWDLGALVEASRARDRLPRLEFVESCAPGLAAELEAAGFAREARLDLMTCAAPVVVPAPEGVTLEAVGADAPREVVRGLLRAARGAFEEAGEPSETDVERYGGGGMLARVAGRPAGGGFFTMPRDGLTELVGIGVLAPFRRRGIAAAVTSALVTAAGADLAFLTPGDDDTRRVYERAGFEATSVMLAYAMD
jgi:GNAT superfamily N-acetyltransferase